MNDEIILTYQEGIATLRVNRPEARNALNWTAQAAFAAAVAHVAGNTAVRVLIITGTGDKAFVSGGDLKELSQHPEREAGERLNRVMRDALVAADPAAHSGHCRRKWGCVWRRLRDSHRLRPARGGQPGPLLFCPGAQCAVHGLGRHWSTGQPAGPGAGARFAADCAHFSAEEAQQLGLVQQVVTMRRGWQRPLSPWHTHSVNCPNKPWPPANSSSMPPASPQPGNQPARNQPLCRFVVPARSPGGAGCFSRKEKTDYQ
jgi:hypothetical protein